jgi:MraZ protein
MPQLLGEYECSIDAKGRMRLPSQLIKQMGELESYHFVINRGFEKNLMLYPKAIWESITSQVNALNPYDKQNRDFLRYFYRGATEVELDNQDRILINKKLMEYGGIDKDMVIFAYNDRMELWSAEEYDKFMNSEPSDFSDLAQKVLGGQQNPE